MKLYSLLKRMTESDISPWQKSRCHSNNTSIASYLTISDQQSGTFLLPVSDSGEIKLLLSTPQRSDMANSDLMVDRSLSANLGFLDNDLAGDPQLLLDVVVDSVEPLYALFDQNVLQYKNNGFVV